MKQEELIALSKQLTICDDRQLVAKVIISYSDIAKVASVLVGGTTSAGREGFIGVYQDQLVCYESNLWGTKPDKEYFRISFEFIKETIMKKGLFGINNVFLIVAEGHKFKLFFTNKRKPIIEQIRRIMNK